MEALLKVERTAFKPPPLKFHVAAQGNMDISSVATISTVEFQCSRGEWDPEPMVVVTWLVLMIQSEEKSDLNLQFNAW